MTTPADTVQAVDPFGDDGITVWFPPPHAGDKAVALRPYRFAAEGITLRSGYANILIPCEPVTFQHLEIVCQQYGFSAAASWLFCRLGGYRFVQTWEAAEA